MASSLRSSFRGTLQRVSKVLAAVAHLRGPSDKIRFLTQDPDARSIVPLLRFTTDPNVTFGITRKVAENALKSPTVSSDGSNSAEPSSVQALLREMHEGKWSRPSLRDPMLARLAAKHQLAADDIETLVRLLDRNLKVGLGPARWRELPLTPDQQQELNALLKPSAQVSAAAQSSAANSKPAVVPAQNKLVPAAASSTTDSSTASRLTAFPGTALGYPFKGKLDSATYFASRKLDGVRMIAIVILDSSTPNSEPVVQCCSRTGKPLSVPSDVVSDLTRLFSPKSANAHDAGSVAWVIDGELCVSGSKPGANDDFDRVISTVRSTRNTANASSVDIHYFIFDVLTLAEFSSKSSSRILSDRLEAFIANTCSSSPISATVPKLTSHSWSTPIPNTSHLHLMTHQPLDGATDVSLVADLMHLARAQGWEGLIVRKDTCYRGSRHKDVLKVKHFADAEYVVVGVDVDQAFRIPRPMLPPVMGPDLAPYLSNKNAIQGREESVVTAPYARAVWVDVPGGQRVAVGSGLSLAQRLEWARHPERIVGRQVTVQYFEKTKDGSLRFPSLKAVYGREGRDV